MSDFSLGSRLPDSQNPDPENKHYTTTSQTLPGRNISAPDLLFLPATRQHSRFCNASHLPTTTSSSSFSPPLPLVAARQEQAHIFMYHLLNLTLHLGPIVRRAVCPGTPCSIKPSLRLTENMGWMIQNNKTCRTSWQAGGRADRVVVGVTELSYGCFSFYFFYPP